MSRIGRSFPIQGAYCTQHARGIPVLSDQTQYGSLTAGTIAVTLGGIVYARTARLRRRCMWDLGGAVVILPLPTQEMTTLRVTSAWKANREARRRVPPTGFVTTPYGLDRFVGVAPPAVITPRSSLSQKQQTIDVALLAIAVRAANRKPKPFFDLFSPTVLAQPPPAAVLQARLTRTRPRPTRSFLRPPTIVGAKVVFSGPEVTLTHTRPRVTCHATRGLIFYPQTSRIKTTLVRARPRHTSGTLALPAVVVAARVFAGPEASPVRLRPRHTASRLAAPTVITATVLPPAPPLRVTLARFAKLRVMRSLGAPTVVNAAATPFGGSQITLTHSRRPNSKSRLSPPQAVAAPVAALAPPVRTSLRVARSVRVHSRLSPPSIVVPLVTTFVARPISVTTVNTRSTGNWRYWVEKILFSPMVVNPPAGPTQQQQTLRVTTVRSPRNARAPHSRLRQVIVAAAAPAAPIETVIQATLTRTRPRRTTSLLRGPTTSRSFVARPVQVTTVNTRSTGNWRYWVEKILFSPMVVNPPAGLTQQQQTIRITTVRSSRSARTPHSKLFTRPLVATPVAPVETVLQVTLARRVTRLFQSELRPPTAVLSPPSLRAQTIQRTLVRRVTRPFQSELRPAAVVLPLPGLHAQTIQATLVRRVTRLYQSELHPPTAVTLPPLARPTDVTLVRRVTRLYRSELQAPTVVVPLPSLRAQTIRASLVRRVTRPFRSQLQPPSVVLPPPSLRAQTVRVALVRRVARPGSWKLNPPTAIRPAPTVSRRTIQVLLTAVQAALRPDRRKPRPRLYPPTKVRAQLLYFSVEPPESGWLTGRLSVDILDDEPSDNWEAGKPL